MKHKKIVFVCTGNTCRSPMAETVLREELKRRKIKWYTISSAGLSARDGDEMNPKSREALKKRGYPVPEFKARRLDKKTVENAFVVICMTEAQKTAIGARNVTTMSFLTGNEVPDPYGMDQSVYDRTLDTIVEGIPLILSNLQIGEEK